MKALLLTILWCLVLAGNDVLAHEVRPASLQIKETSDGALSVYWRQPVSGEYTIAIRPMLSSGWLDRDPDERYLMEDALIKVWNIPPPHEPLAGQTIYIQGLDSTITDTFVQVSGPGGFEQSGLIKAVSPRMQISPAQEPEYSIPGYMTFGIEHIWSGPDHLVYVLGLILLISSLRSLIVTISAFTVAHSMTLAAAALGYLQLRSAPVEAVISLSIVYVAVELVRVQEGRGTLASRVPWIMAFLFGLLHGFGFASALVKTGLPDGTVLHALFLFNVGIEVGQLLFLLVILGLLKLLQVYLPIFSRALLRVSPYGIGSVASYWLIQRLAVIF